MYLSCFMSKYRRVLSPRGHSWQREATPEQSNRGNSRRRFDVVRGTTMFGVACREPAKGTTSASGARYNRVAAAATKRAAVENRVQQRSAPRAGQTLECAHECGTYACYVLRPDKRRMLRVFPRRSNQEERLIGTRRPRGFNMSMKVSIEPRGAASWFAVYVIAISAEGFFPPLVTLMPRICLEEVAKCTLRLSVYVYASGTCMKEGLKCMFLCIPPSPFVYYCKLNLAELAFIL